jgi:hypothetical protein
MDNQKDNQDLVVGDDGSMKQDNASNVEETQNQPSSEVSESTNIEVKTEETSSEPTLDETSPPPEQEMQNDEEAQNDESSEGDKSSAEEAVNFIAGDSTAEEDVSETEEVAVKNESTEAIVVEAPSDANDTDAAKQSEDESDNSALDSQDNSSNKVTDDSTELNSAALAGATTTSTDSDTQPGMSNNEQSNHHEHRNNKKLAVIVTVLVALVLSGAAVFAYMSAQNNTEETSTQTNSTAEVQDIPTNEVAPATEEDIQNTINEIDQNIDSLDSAELDEESISDDTLGL